MRQLQRGRYGGGTKLRQALGLTAVGKVGQLIRFRDVRAIARGYSSAFSQNARTYPYWLG